MNRTASSTQTQNQTQWGIFAVLIASFLWGTTGTAASFAPTLSPLAIGAIAMGGGGLLQALLAIKYIQRNLSKLRQQRTILLLGGLGVGIYPLTFYSSMHYAGVTIGTVVSIGTAPLFTALLERIVDRRELSKRWLISFVLGVIGIVCLSLGESKVTAIATEETHKLLGIVLGCVAGLTYSLYSWCAQKLMQRGIESKASMGMIFGLGALLLLPTLYFTGGNLLHESINIYVAAYMTLIPMFLGYLLFGFGLKTVPASQAVTLTLFEPFIAAIFAMTLVGEHLALIGWMGLALIFSCLLVLAKG